MAMVIGSLRHRLQIGCDVWKVESNIVMEITIILVECSQRNKHTLHFV